jgi:hypothetical protein
VGCTVGRAELLEAKFESLSETLLEAMLEFAVGSDVGIDVGIAVGNDVGIDVVTAVGADVGIDVGTAAWKQCRSRCRHSCLEAMSELKLSEIAVQGRRRNRNRGSMFQML